MASKKKEKKKKEKGPGLKVRLKDFFSRNKMLCMVFAAVMFLVGGVGFIVYGYVSYNQTTRESFIVAGMKAMEDGNFHKAQSLLLKATYLDAYEAYPFLAWLSAKAGNFNKALEYCRQCAKYPDIYGAYETMGYLALLGYGNAQGAGSAIFYFNESLKDYMRDMEDASEEEKEKVKNELLLSMYEKSIPLCMNKQDYIRIIDEAQKLGSINALLYRGDIDFLGEANDISPNSAVKSWQDAKTNGILEAQTRLAGMMWYGYGQRRDYKGALRYYEDAAKKHEPVANYSLGLIRLRQHKKTSYAEGIRYMKNAAKLNYGPALTAVGVNALTHTNDIEKIASAAADIFKQAYDCGDTTGGILYALMMLNGFGISKDQTEALSILYDLKTRGVSAVASMLKFFTYNSDVNTKKLMMQAIKLCSMVYSGELIFHEGAPEAYMYHDKSPDNIASTLNYYIPQSEDRDRDTEEFIADLGNNFIEKLNDPETTEVNGEKLVYPEIVDILEIYNPTTGAKPFMPQVVLDISANMPRLPKEYDKYNINYEVIRDNFLDFY